ncbi:PucR-like helix-turn-helix protein [Anoxybacillus vitaminiphilus]|uniref:PucR-like helix-turn-helix protein n=1 Tax=Paranoxybacillus vitaminiphilus TaxID=581036 RepID=A0A327YH17_9BACL|nr:helix-turn-helix domain-containing protein [Anoxybacillus vitaminiphilus]RAK19456.1 PucR-like helix-turn-helix protein [Anoxybacillus vitaminiphilus]
MLEQLKAHYKEALTTDKSISNPNDYEWFYTNSGEQLGILKRHLTEQEKQLLSIFLTPIPQNQPFTNKQEFIWYNFLIHGNTKQIDLQQNHAPCYRFIQFHLKQTTVYKEDFCAAVKELLPSNLIIIWENAHQGVIIEEKNEGDRDVVSFAEFIDTLSSDLYINLRIFVGQVYPFSETLREYYMMEKQYFRLALAHISKQNILTIEDVFPLLLIKSSINNKELQHAIHFIDSIKEDDELFQAIKAFFECNLNVSLAAKKLYMHRNSLQYRIEKFSERTGIEIKHFKGAVTTYLAMLAHQYLNHENRQDA